MMAGETLSFCHAAGRLTFCHTFISLYALTLLGDSIRMGFSANGFNRSLKMSDQTARQELEAVHGQVWDTSELQKDFEVTGFGYGLCVVKRKSDGQVGSLDFDHSPRFYYSFVKGN